MKPYLLPIVLLLSSLFSFGQPEDLITNIDTYTLFTNSVNTPKGANVESLKFENCIYLGNTYSDYTADYKAAYKYAFEHNPANLYKTVKGDITKKYNCHSYAWNISEGGTSVHWIDAGLDSQGTSGSGNLSKYWAINGGYCQVSGISSAAKIYYSSGDHSARVTSPSTGTVISKWGNKLLVEHGYNDCPYDKTTIQYYKLDYPTIYGTSGVLCNSNQRTIGTDFSAPSTSWTYDWNVSGYLNQVSGDGTPNYTVSSTSGNGSGTINLTVTSPSGMTASTQKSIGVNMPYYTDLSLSLYTNTGTPVSYMCPNRHYHIYLNNNSGCSLSNYTWSVPAWWSINYTSSNMVSVYTNSSPGGRVEVSATTCCGVYTSVIIGYFGSGYCGSSYAMSLSPNPSNGEATLSIEPASEDVVLDENAEWGVEIFDQMQVLKEQNAKLKGKELKIKTTGWKAGIYIVRVKYKDEYLQGKLLVQ